MNKVFTRFVNMAFVDCQNTDTGFLTRHRINTMTKEEAIRRFKAAKQTKKDAVAALEQKMKQAYEERTGLKANYVVTL